MNCDVIEVNKVLKDIFKIEYPNRNGDLQEELSHFTLRTNSLPNAPRITFHIYIYIAILSLASDNAFSHNILVTFI